MTSSLKTMSVIDVDIHQTLANSQELLPYVPEPWRKQYGRLGAGGGGLSLHNPVGVMRRDCLPPSGGPAASDPDFMVEDLLKPHGIEYGILTGDMMSVSSLHDPDYGAALATAYNDHLADRWLGKHPQYRGMILVSAHDPDLAAREIERMADHPLMVGVLMGSAQRAPLGQRRFYPIYEAAERHGLPIAIHPGTEGTGGLPPPTGHGYPTRYLEWHTSLSQNYIAHLTSLISEGVFERFPGLKFALLEGGIAWLPGLMWQLDKSFRQLKETMPWMKRLPSRVIREHCLLSTQPIEEPDDPKQLLTLFEMMDAENILMFSTDYPHWDNDMPGEVLKKLKPDVRQKIFYDNAKQLYGL